MMMIYIYIYIYILHYLKDPKNYGNYGIFLIMVNAGFIPSTALLLMPVTAPSRVVSTVFP